MFDHPIQGVVGLAAEGRHHAGVARRRAERIVSAEARTDDGGERDLVGRSQAGRQVVDQFHDPAHRPRRAGAGLRLRGVGWGPFERDHHPAGRAAEGSGPHNDLSQRKTGQVVEGKDEIGADLREPPVPDDGLGAVAVFFGGLKEQHHPPPSRPRGGEFFDRPQARIAMWPSWPHACDLPSTVEQCAARLSSRIGNPSSSQRRSTVGPGSAPEKTKATPCPPNPRMVSSGRRGSKNRQIRAAVSASDPDSSGCRCNSRRRSAAELILANNSFSGGHPPPSELHGCGRARCRSSRR